MCIPGENMQAAQCPAWSFRNSEGSIPNTFLYSAENLLWLSYPTARATWARLSPDSSSRADAFSIRCCRMWAAMELPYSALNSSFMVEGFIRNRRDSCSDGDAAVQVFRQQLVDLVDDLPLLGRQAGGVLPGVGVHGGRWGAWGMASSRGQVTSTVRSMTWCSSPATSVSAAR